MPKHDFQTEGLWEGYDGEWGHVSQQLIALAEAIPADKYSWRPAPGVRSVSEVFMHIAIANFWSVELHRTEDACRHEADGLEKTVTEKADVIDWLKRSLDAVKTARAQLKPGDLGAQGEDRGQNSDRRWHVPAHHHPRQ